MDDLNKKYYNLDSLDNINDIDCVEESCINCFYSNGHYCPIQRRYINSKTPICWSYRDCFTMRTNSDFQDDNEDFYEYE